MTDEEHPEDGERTYRDCVIIDDKGNIKGFNYTNLAKHVMMEFNTLSLSGSILYIYRENKYKRNEGEVEEFLEYIISKKLKYTGSRKRIIQEIFDILLHNNNHTISPFNKEFGYIPVKNGVLKIDYDSNSKRLTEKIQLLEHSPKFKFTFVFPVEYKPDVDISGISDILKSWYDNEEYEEFENCYTGEIPTILLQIPAQALLQLQGMDTFKKSYIIQGDYNMGKSSYIELLENTFGKENCSNVSLQDMCSEKFSIPSLENKLLNLYEDLNDNDIKGIGKFKNFTGGNEFEIEQKFINRYKARIFAVNCFACNRPPKIDKSFENDDAFWNRWEYIKFKTYFPIDNSWKQKNLVGDNLSAFLNLVIVCSFEIYKLKQPILISDASVVRDMWENNSDPLWRWLEENFTNIDSFEITYPKRPIYDMYTKWENDNNVPDTQRVKSLEHFGRLLYKYGWHDHRVRTKGKADTKWTHVFKTRWKSIEEIKHGQMKVTNAEDLILTT